MEHKYSVKVIADNSGKKYCGNQVSFETIEAAQQYGYSLALRWTLVRSWAVFEGDQLIEEHEA